MWIRRIAAVVVLAGAAMCPGQSRIQDAWDALIPQATADPVLTPPQIDVKKSAAGDFLNHFFLETRTEYWRTQTSFTGLPTATGVINAPFTGVFNPDGIPYQPAFQPDANRLYSFIDWGTRGWLSGRVNTHFSFRYRQDLSHVDVGAPAQNVIETFGSNRRIEVLGAAMEINGRPTDGVFAGTSLTVGRQYVYGAELAELDGASFTVDRRRFAVTVFGGRRFSNFSDPIQRAIGGSNVVFRLDADTSLGFESLFYIHGSHRVDFRRRIHNDWLFSTYFRVFGGSPVDYNAQVFWTRRTGRSSARFSFFQKLSGKDYGFDFTEAARDQDPYNRLPRLYLGPENPYSQFVVDARHQLTAWLGLSGSAWVRRLNDTRDQSAFNTSFEDYRAGAQLFPIRRLETDWDYHQRNSNRLPSSPDTLFDDVSRSGETSVKDLSAQLRRTFAEGRLTLSGGAYYRRIDMQDRFFSIKDAHQSGWLGSAWWRLDSRTRVFLDYALDNDFFVFKPSIQNARVLRVALAWKY
jgi:hypothetical protein